MAPALASAGDQGILLTWLEPSNSKPSDGERSRMLRFSSLRGNDWSAPVTLSTGSSFFANWADVPGAVRSSDGNIFVHWLEKLGDATYAYGVQLTLSTDDGESWEPIGLLHDDASPVEHGFVSWVPVAGGVRAFWLDGREMAPSKGGPMQLRTAVVTDSGVPQTSILLDDRVCECCSTDAALTRAGPVVVYRDRSDNEIRDIALIRLTDSGWSDPAIVGGDGWEINGCPVNGPAVAAAKEDVAVAWFTAAEGKSQVQVALSEDGGRSFATPHVVDEFLPMGRVDVALDSEGTAWVLWMARAGEVRLQSVIAGGPQGEALSIDTISATRASGFPKLIADSDNLLLVWRNDGTLRASRVPLLGISETRH